MSSLGAFGARMARPTNTLVSAMRTARFDRTTGKMPNGRPIGENLPFQISSAPRMAVTLTVFCTVGFAVPFVAIKFQKWKAER